MGRKSGFSLIEILISTAILLVIVVMVSLVFQQQSAAFQTGEDRVKGQSTIRNAMGMIIRDLSMAVDSADYDNPPADNSFSGSTSIKFLATSGELRRDGNEPKGAVLQFIEYSASGGILTRKATDYTFQNGNWKKGNVSEAKINNGNPLEGLSFDAQGGKPSFPDRVTIYAACRGVSHASTVSGQSAGKDKTFGTDDDIYVGAKP